MMMGCARPSLRRARNLQRVTTAVASGERTGIAAAHVKVHLVQRVLAVREIHLGSHLGRRGDGTGVAEAKRVLRLLVLARVVLVNTPQFEVLTIGSDTAKKENGGVSNGVSPLLYILLLYS